MKRKADEEAAASEREEEEERRKDVEEFDRRIRELELQRSKLLVGKFGKNGAGFPPSPEGSNRGRSNYKSGDIGSDKSMVKQVSNLSMRKVSPTPPAMSSDASGSTTCCDPLLLGVWEKPKDIPPVELNSSCQLTGHYWEHLSNYAFKRAAMTFPTWNLSWPKQNRGGMRIG
jgi:hypothetical protein